MSFFTNKHVIASMIIAPILAILSWYAIGYFVDETPEQLKSAGIYTLSERPNCRWGSGYCELLNNDVEFKFTAIDRGNALQTVNLQSTIILDNVLIALVNTRDETDIQPVSMLKENDYNFLINIENVSNNQFLQLIFKVESSIFYATIPTIWIFKEELIYDQLNNDN